MKKNVTRWLIIFAAMFFAQDYVFAQDPGFANQQTAAISANFYAKWQATPSHDTMDCASGLGMAEAAAEGWKAMGPYVHFNKAGEIEARDGANGFAAENVLPYVGGKAYTIEVHGDVAAQTYDLYVTPEDSASATQIASGYAFRTNNPQDTLNYLIMVAGQLEAWGGIPGSTLACSFMDDPYTKASYELETTDNEALASQTEKFIATFDVVPTLALGSDIAIGLSEGALARDFQWGNAYGSLSTYVIFGQDTTIYSGKNTAWPDPRVKIPYELGVKYTVKMEVDPVNETYDLSITPEGGSDTVIVEGWGFRKTGVSAIDNLVMFNHIGGTWGGIPGDLEVSNLQVALAPKDDWNEIAVVGDVKPAGRGYGEMAPLGDGKALIFGGNTARYSAHVDSLTWVYDTETDTWTEMAPAGDIPPARGRHGMAYAGDDQAIVFGGQSDTSASGFFGDTWIYDLSDNAWTKKADAPATLFERMEAAMAYVGDDKVLLFGGNDASGDMNDTWVYDVSDDTWTELFAIGAAGQPSAMIACMAYAGDDKVVLYGKQAETWVFDLSDNTWTEMTTANTPAVSGQGMAYLGDGNVLLYGGYDAAFARESKTWIYNLAENTWTEETPESTPPTGNMIVTLCETTMYGGANIVCFGGRGTGGDAMDVTFEFGGGDWALNADPPLVPGDWTLEAPATSPPASTYNEAAYVADGKILAFGGKDAKWGIVVAPDTWIYDTETGEWTNMAPTGYSPEPRYAFGMSHIGDDKVLMYGGSDGAANWTTTLVYDLSDNTWTDMGVTGPTAQVYGTMTYLGDDKAMFLGGKDMIGDAVSLKDAWVYDLSDNTWTLVDTTGVPHPGAGGDGVIYPLMSYFSEGKALMFGGLWTNAGWNNETWEFDVATMAWTQLDPSGDIPSLSILGDMVYMGRGVAMAYGGFTGTYLYDGNSNTWTHKDTTTIVPTFSRQAGLAGSKISGGGEVVLFGGYTPVDNSTAGNETWTHPQGLADLVPGDWTMGAPATSPPATTYNEAAHVADGKVLAFGGKDAKWGIVVAPDTWIYDTETGEWTNMAPTGYSPEPRYAFGMSHIGDDKVLMYGGSDGAANWTTTLVYDLSDNTWTDMGVTGPTAQVYGTMTYLGDDKAMFLGGKDMIGDAVSLKDAWVYDLSDNTWTLVDTTGVPHPGAGGDGVIYPLMSYFSEGKALMFGGLWTNAGWNNELWEFDVETMTWTQLDPSGDIPSLSILGDMVYMGQNEAMAYGGFTGTYLYNGDTNAWTHKDTTTIVPTFSRQAGLAGSMIRGGGEIVLFGGYTPADNSTAGNETWTHPQNEADIIESVKPNMASHEFGFYPNPVNDMLYVSSDQEVLQLEVYSVQGQQLIVESTVGQLSPTMDVSSLPEGVYVLYVSTANGKGSKLFVKQ
ncbi:MAG: kelch repeat-containing protein [Bacteroidota bacterium]